jgi:hypothetical protein
MICMRFLKTFLAGLLLTGTLALAPDTSFARGGGGGGHFGGGAHFGGGGHFGGFGSRGFGAVGHGFHGPIAHKNSQLTCGDITITCETGALARSSE